MKISSLEEVRPRTEAMLSREQQETLRLAMDTVHDKHFKKSARLFGILASQMHASGSPLSEDMAAMKANEALLEGKVELSRNRPAAEMCLNKALDAIAEALKPDEYWAEYLSLEKNLRTFTHTEFGCKITRNVNGSWEVRCIDVSNALGIPGLSRSELYDLECSICGADPMYCPHIRGKTYGGRLAVGIVKNLKINHIAIMAKGLPQERNIGIFPRPLSDADIRNIFSEGKATQILATNEMRCSDLIRVIRAKQLGGTDFVPPHHR